MVDLFENLPLNESPSLRLIQGSGLNLIKVPNSENLNTELCEMRKMGHFRHCLIPRFLNKIELRTKSSQLHSTPCLPVVIRWWL